MQEWDASTAVTDQISVRGCPGGAWPQLLMLWVHWQRGPSCPRSSPWQSLLCRGACLWWRMVVSLPAHWGKLRDPKSSKALPTALGFFPQHIGPSVLYAQGASLSSWPLLLPGRPLCAERDWPHNDYGPFSLKRVIYFSGDLRWWSVISASPAPPKKGAPKAIPSSSPHLARGVEWAWYIYLILRKTWDRYFQN